MLPDQWTRETTTELYESGLRQMTLEEVRNKSIEWLREVPMRHYLYALGHRDSPEFEQLRSTLNPADHINLIMLLLPEACKN